jgi:hypothetical protein
MKISLLPTSSCGEMLLAEHTRHIKEAETEKDG